VTVLETERLVLRHLVEDDDEFILELVNDPAWIRYIGDKGMRTVEAARAYIVRGPIAMYERLGFGLYRVELKATGEALGICGLIKRETLADVDIGFAFLRRHWGRGYAREAAAATLDFGRRVLGLERIVAIVSPENESSTRLLEKIGLRHAETLRLAGEERDVMLFTTAPGS
jgi:RimJ/RimL family protein N-acetyltransferase